MNRLTISLPDDLYAMAKAHAVSTKTSISKAIGDLLRRVTSQQHAGGLMLSSPASEANSYFDPVLGIQVSRCDRSLSMKDIQCAIDDEDARNLEIMGISPEGTEHSLT